MGKTAVIREIAPHTSGKIEIQKGVPIPAQRGGKNKVYPFKEMEVGDSFLASDDGTPRFQARLSSAAAYHAKSLGRKFTTRSVDGGVRVWRTA